MDGRQAPFAGGYSAPCRAQRACAKDLARDQKIDLVQSTSARADDLPGLFSGSRVDAALSDDLAARIVQSPPAHRLRIRPALHPLGSLHRIRPPRPLSRDGPALAPWIPQKRVHQFYLRLTGWHIRLVRLDSLPAMAEPAHPVFVEFREDHRPQIDAEAVRAV